VRDFSRSALLTTSPGSTLLQLRLMSTLHLSRPFAYVWTRLITTSGGLYEIWVVSIVKILYEGGVNDVCNIQTARTLISHSTM
jgi:hypothetical protein